MESIRGSFKLNVILMFDLDRRTFSLNDLVWYVLMRQKLHHVFHYDVAYVHGAMVAQNGVGAPRLKHLVVGFQHLL